MDGQSRAGQRTEPEDDRAHWHVGQVCTKKASKGNDGSDTEIMPFTEQGDHLWQLAEGELFEVCIPLKTISLYLKNYISKQSYSARLLCKAQGRSLKSPSL